MNKLVETKCHRRLKERCLLFDWLEIGDWRLEMAKWRFVEDKNLGIASNMLLDR
jgi:hypothetical protein